MGSLATFGLMLAVGCGYGREGCGYGEGSCGYGGGGYAITRGSTPPAGKVADLTITIKGINGDMSFSPNPASVRIGQTVAWRNAGGTTHTATQNGRSFDTGFIGNGSTSGSITMKTAGTFGYHCSIHPSMVGTLNVTQ